MANIVIVYSTSIDKNIKAHSHEDHELISCVEGSSVVKTNTQTISFSKGDYLLIPPNTIHSHEQVKNNTNRVLIFSDWISTHDKILKFHDNEKNTISLLLDQLCYYSYISIANKNIIIQSLLDTIINLLETSTSKQLNATVQNIISKIHTNFQDPYFDLTAYIKTIPQNVNYTRRIFTSEMKMPPHAYLNNIRLTNAKKMLLKQSYLGFNINEISFACGFKDPLYFSRLFKNKYKLSPQNYIKSKP